MPGAAFLCTLHEDNCKVASVAHYGMRHGERSQWILLKWDDSNRKAGGCRGGYHPRGEHLLALKRCFLVLVSTEEHITIHLGPYSVSKGNQM